MSKTISVNKLLISTAFLCSILSAVMASWELSTLFLALFLFAIIVGLAIELDYLPALPRIIINVSTLALLIIILSQLRFNYIIEPLMKIVLVMTAVKMIEKKSVRDYLQLLLLGLMMLICCSMIYVDKSFIIYCFGGGIMWTFVMVLCSFQTKDPHAEIQLKNLLQLFYRLLFIFLLMVPFCLLMFIVTPRIRSPFLGVISSSNSDQGGFNDHVSLGVVNEAQKNKKLAFRAEINKRLPFAMYWRGVVMDSFDGETWRSSQIPTTSRHLFRSGDVIKQEIYLEPGRRRYLIALDIPVQVSITNAHVTGDGEIIYTGRNDGRRLQYSATSVISNVMRIDDENFKRELYLGLPNDFIPELKSEVMKITEGLEQTQKVNAILKYLSPPNFEYSHTEMSDTQNALEQFIFVNKKGRCEYFASAMGVMLRMADIPSRLVGGYKRGIYNDTGGYYSVLEDNAHVWVEFWDEQNSSWIRLDPTPPSPLGGSDIDFGLLEAYLDLLDYMWTKYVLNYNLKIQGEVVESIKNIISNPGVPDFEEYFGRITLITGAIALIIIVIYFLRRMIVRDMGIVLLHNFIRIMKRKGFNKHKSEGLQEFSNSLPDHEKIKVMPFIKRFEEHFYKEIEFDEMTVKTLRENLKNIK